MLLTQKRGTEPATVPLHGSIWLKSTEQKVLTFSAITWEISFNPHLPGTLLHSLLRIFFSSLKTPSGNNCNFTLWHTLNVSAFERLSQCSTYSGSWRSFLDSVCTDWDWSSLGVAPLLSLFVLFFFKFKSYPYAQRNQPYLMTFMDTVQCRRITQPLCANCWFLTKHKCVMLTSKTIRRFNVAGQDQQFLKLILHIEHRLNLVWGNFGRMN